MTIKWISNNTELDISNFVSSITWSGSVSQASRSLELSLVYSPFDKNIKDIGIKPGDRLKLYEDGKLLINAMVYTRERVSEQGTISYTGRDELNRLLRSNGTYNFKNTTPERIVTTVCNDLKVSTGTIAETKVPIKKMLVDGESFYNIIMKAYTKAYKSTGKKYMPFMYNEKLSILEKGEAISDFYLKDDVNITASDYSESIENIVNKVKIYDDKGKQIGEVKNPDSINLHGIFQDVYTKEDGVNPITAANNMLTGTEKTASIEGIGNVSCISGYSVKIKDSITGLTGKFWIDNDSHTWENGIHTMSLELAFKNLMDIQEDDT